MANPYFTNSLDLLPNTRARAGDVESNLTAVEVGFDGVKTDMDNKAPLTLVADVALKAPIASPTFTGDPKAPTPTDGDNDTSIATTAFVQRVIALAAALNLPSVVGNDRKTLRVLSGVPSWSDAAYQTPIHVTGNVNATVGVPHFITAAAVITLPASPAAGDVVPFRKKTAAGVAVSFARNTKPIETLAEDLVLDGENDTGILVYADGTRGWLIFKG